MPRRIEFQGRIIEVPDNFTDEQIGAVLRAPAAEQPAAPAPAAAPLGPDQATPPPIPTAQTSYYKPPTLTDRLMGALGYANQTGAVAARELTKGVANLAGAPVGLVNAGLAMAGAPVSDNPIGGAQMFDTVLHAPARVLSAASNAVGVPSNPDPQPQDTFQAIAGRVGNEIGASALPVAGVMARGANLGVQASRAMANAPSAVAAPSAIPGVQAARQFGNDLAGAGRATLGGMYEAAAVNPAGLLSRETQMAAAAGAGAGMANAAAGNPQQGNNFWSDFLGSLGGVGALAAGKNAAGAVGNLAGAALNRPAMVNDVVGETVADRLINASTRMGEQAASAPPGRALDTAPLAQALRRPSMAEEIIPGFRANIGDRTVDPGLTAFSFNVDAARPGAGSARRVNNESAINEAMAGVAPTGNPAMLRAQLEAYRTGQIGSMEQMRDNVQRQAFEAGQAVIPSMPLAETRGAAVRGALQQAYDNANTKVTQAWGPVNQSTAEIPVSPLVDLYQQRMQALPLNDQARFLPAEAGAPAALAARGEAAPLKEFQAVRAGLGEDIRTATAAGNKPQARVAGDFQKTLDQYLENAMPPELRSAYEAARAQSRDFSTRFNRDGDAITEVLRRREGSGYQVPDSGVAGRFVPPDSGPVKDYRALIKEAGNDPRVKPALQDEILSDVQRRGLIERPEALAKYMGERSVVFSDFPELRGKLQQAGMTAENLRSVERSLKETTARLTTPGRSATASYLKYGDENVTQAVRTVIANPDPANAAKELLRNAGDTPQTRASMRAALWEEVKRIGKEQAPGTTGEVRWNGKRLAATFRDPRVDAVAREIWSDAPEELANIKRLTQALEGAEGSSRARTPGSSGTAQALTENFDPALSAASVASRLRSVNRGQLSPGIATIDLAATWLRRKSAQVQSGAIEKLTAEAVNNPGLAAILLERYNPADYAAKRRMILQKYGVRATQTLNILDEAHNQDPAMEAIKRKAN